MAPVRSSPARRRVLPVLLLVTLFAVGMLSGCARGRAALAVQPDDTVTGEIVIATPTKGPDDPGPVITLPAELSSKVDVTQYRQDDYAGSLLRFSKLSFSEVGMLTSVAGAPGRNVTFQMRRAGGRVLVSGAVDLTTVSVDKADFQLKISFPGDVVESNGEVDSDTVSWTFTPGEVGDFDATVAYADPNAPSPVNWTLGLGLIVAIAAALIVLTARRTRNPPLSQTLR